MQSVNDLEKEAIGFIQMAAQKAGTELLVGFSGGKDSIVLEHLARQAGVKNLVVYSATRMDPPEVVRFIKTYYPDCQFAQAKKTFFKSIPNRNPPLIYARWCCSYLKKLSGRFPHKHRLMGIRKEESSKRSKYSRINVFKKLDYTQYYPIFDWPVWAIWDYIEKHKLPYPPLYDEGFERLGCVICPYHTKKQHDIYRAKWPYLFKAFERSVVIWFEKRVSQGRTMANKTPQDFLNDWYEGKASWYIGKNKKSNQLTLWED